MRKTIIGVMGPGDNATQTDIDNASRLGTEIAKKGWLVLSGGRNAGVMEAVSMSAREAGGMTIGILPTKDRSTLSNGVTIPIVTNMGSGRNVINVLTSDIIVACGIGAGTASEIALAIKECTPVIIFGTK